MPVQLHCQTFMAKYSQNNFRLLVTWCDVNTCDGIKELQESSIQPIPRWQELVRHRFSGCGSLTCEPRRVSGGAQQRSTPGLTASGSPFQDGRITCASCSVHLHHVRSTHPVWGDGRPGITKIAWFDTGFKVERLGDQSPQTGSE